jgi:AcrR family transcriptional regulator
VSHAAPKNHFENLDALKAAIVAEGFRQHCDLMRAKMARAADDPQAQLIAAAQGYVDFAVRNQDLFRLMFSTSRWKTGSDDLDTAAAASYAVLREVCAPIAAGRASPAVHAAVIETMVWSWLHGYAALRIATGFKRAESELGRIPGVEEAMPDFLRVIAP